MSRVDGRSVVGRRPRGTGEAPTSPEVTGGGAGTIRGGQHLIYPEDTPLSNLQLTLLNAMGVAAEAVGDSNGQFKELSELSSAPAR